MSDSVLMVEEYENAVTYTAQSANKNSRREQMAVLAIAVAVVVNTVMEIAKVSGREKKKGCGDDTSWYPQPGIPEGESYALACVRVSAPEMMRARVGWPT